MAGFRYFAIDGPTLLTRAGAVGTAGKDETETCASAVVFADR